MKLDRNINGTGRGKYGLVNNRSVLISSARTDASGRRSPRLRHSKIQCRGRHADNTNFRRIN